MENGGIFFNFTVEKYSFVMVTFIGDYNCKLDAKGRVLLPSSFRKLLGGDSEGRCVLRKNMYENCIDLFPIQEWERQVEEISRKITRLERTNDGFMRQFFRDTAELQVDSNGRILIPKKFFAKVALGKELMLAGQQGKIEIWDAEAYEESAWSEADFSNFANEIFGADTAEE